MGVLPWTSERVIHAVGTPIVEVVNVYTAGTPSWVGGRVSIASCILLRVHQVFALEFYCAFTAHIKYVLDYYPGPRARQASTSARTFLLYTVAVYATQTTTAHVCCSLQHDHTYRFAVCPWFVVSRISAFHNNPAPFCLGHHVLNYEPFAHTRDQARSHIYSRKKNRNFLFAAPRTSFANFPDCFLRGWLHDVSASLLVYMNNPSPKSMVRPHPFICWW